MLAGAHGALRRQPDSGGGLPGQPPCLVKAQPRHRELRLRHHAAGRHVALPVDPEGAAARPAGDAFARRTLADLPVGDGQPLLHGLGPLPELLRRKPKSVPCHGVFCRLIGGMRSHQQHLRQVSSQLMAYETESLHNLDAIKGFGITGRYSDGLRQQQEDFRQASLDYNLFSIKTEALLSILGSAVQMAAFCYCLYLLWSGRILYGTMTLFLSQGTKLTSAFNSLVRTVPNFLSASVSARRIRDLFDLPPEPAQPLDEALERAAAKGFTVQVEAADFAYDPAQPVLRRAALTAAPGEIVALVGPSGGGKTTMIRLLLGLIHPSEGRACLRTCDGQQLEMDAALRRFFSYVPQGNTLLSGTIADNLRMVRPEADDAALEQALRAACAWEFVSKMPEGLNATVGEHGHGLSEGQAQRIAIARALLRDAPVLLLDEATSALDVATERAILRNLVREYPHKTCIVTTHRPTIIGLCQRVYQVSGGELRQLSAEEAQRLAMEF